MAAVEIQLYAPGDVFTQGEYPTIDKWNDNVLIHHQDEFERRDMLVYKWLQQLVVDDSVVNTATYEDFDAIVDGKRYYAAALVVDLTNLTASTLYHVRFSTDDYELHVDEDFHVGGGLYIGTLTKNVSNVVTAILCPSTIITDGIMSTIVAIMPTDATTANTPLLLRYNASALELSIDNGATWAQVGSGGGVTAHNALTHLSYATAGHTGFQIAMGADDNYVTDTEKGNLHAPGSDDQNLDAYALKTNVLELDNSSSFVPTADYHPATKKFVDDHVGGGVTSHELLANLEYENSGHSGFEPSRGVDDNFVTSAQLAAIADIPAVETGSSLRTKLGVTTLSGSNTGDENLASLRSKLGVSVLSGNNTGDVLKAVAGEVDTGTNDTKFITPLALQTSKRNIRHMVFGVLAPDANQTASTSVQIGSTQRSRVAGVITAVGCYDEVAGITGTATYDIHKNGTTIMASTKIYIESGEDSSLTAATQPVLSTTALAVDDKLTFFCLDIQTGTAAKGLTFWLDIREN